MRIFKLIKYMYFYVKGGINFRSNDFKSAQYFFEKATQYSDYYKNELFYQYYGQTLLSIGLINESFIWLSKAYKELDQKGWEVSTDEEYKLLNGTLDGLKYLNDSFNLKIDDFIYKKEIRWKN